MKRALCALAVAAAIGAAAGCSSPTISTATDSLTTIQVVAAESVWAEVATQIGGTNVHVTTLTNGSGDKKAVAGAQVLIVNGAGLDPWASEDAATNPGVGRLDVNVGDEVGVTPGGDPYLWYDPAYVNAAAERIEADFAQLRPGSATYFQQQEQAFERSSQATDEALASTIKSRFAGTHVTTCAGLASDVAAHLGLKPQQKLTQSKALLCDTQGDRSLLAAAASAKIPVVSLTETLAPAGTTFQQWLTAQLQQIQQALT
ncbi:MAG TPA: zinc ABC transporter substrate-binding protein [Actinospica sp.]|jgi:zinc/manganese transport system substrate-binding protein|nr:zinc ABC transporter substrate-binding protein [Actinospica sp.]